MRGSLLAVLLIGCGASDPGPQTMTVVIQGATTNAGSTPPGISCNAAGGACTHDFPFGTHVALATGGMSPNCYIVTCWASPTSAGTCNDITMDEPVMVTVGCYNP